MIRVEFRQDFFFFVADFVYARATRRGLEKVRFNVSKWLWIFGVTENVGFGVYKIFDSFS